ncbi:hypothetical protein [Dyadobacter sp. 3J3]|uniref:hypothetical protein n=1 Tax=Dyadobacter sp. 3J3 TaxID=2606600 RepID=UPI001357D4E1|nr:hypothetical protein [Dyadobacter sp. 3J3]
MKNYFLICISVYAILSISGCRQARYITERHIKTDIEKHEVGKQSNIRTYSIFKGNTIGMSRYIELTGYKLNGEKGLIVGADRNYITRVKYKGAVAVSEYTNVDFIHLNIDQTKSILSNYSVLVEKIKNEKPQVNEEVYYDFTVSKDCFISFRRTNMGNNTEYIYFWINGEKYQLRTAVLINRLKKFVAY